VGAAKIRAHGQPTISKYCSNFLYHYVYAWWLGLSKSKQNVSLLKLRQESGSALPCIINVRKHFKYQTTFGINIRISACCLDIQFLKIKLIKFVIFIA
jgi:hypothetical protein